MENLGCVYASSSSRKWDCSVYAAGYQNNSERDKKSIPENVKEEWGFDSDYLERRNS